jgi:hypothetical protein
MQSFVQGSNTFTNSGNTYNQALLNPKICSDLCYCTGGNCSQSNPNGKNFSNQIIGNLQTVQGYYSSTYAPGGVVCKSNSSGCLFYKMMDVTYKAFNSVLVPKLDSIFNSGNPNIEQTTYNFDINPAYHQYAATIADINGCDANSLIGVVSIVNSWITSNGIQLPFMMSSQLPQ